MSSNLDKGALLQRELAYVRSEYEELMSAISHDLSAPFRQTEGFAQIILKNNETLFDASTKRHFGFIAMGAEKGKATIDALREFSHLNRNNREFVEFDCQGLVQDVLQSLSNWVEQAEAIIDVQELPKITGDKEQIYKVFIHLIKNALLYQDPSQATKITISCDEKDSHWTFRVSDNGIGIPHNMDERIFKILKRAVASDQYPGQGMGLSIAKKILHRHGGSIKLIRDNSNDTIFSFTISKHPIAL